MSLKALAAKIAKEGRFGDDVLVHMSRHEVAGLAALAPGGKLPVNPTTGLPEAFFFLPFLAGMFGAAAPAAAAGTMAATAAAAPAAAGALGSGIAAGLSAASTALPTVAASALPAAEIAAAAAPTVASTVAPSLAVLPAEAAATGISALGSDAALGGAALTNAAATPATAAVAAPAVSAPTVAATPVGIQAIGSDAALGGAAVTNAAAPVAATTAANSAAPVTVASKGLGSLMGGIDPTMLMMGASMLQGLDFGGGDDDGEEEKELSDDAYYEKGGVDPTFPGSDYEGGIDDEWDYFPGMKSGGLVKNYRGGGPISGERQLEIMKTNFANGTSPVGPHPDAVGGPYNYQGGLWDMVAQANPNSWLGEHYQAKMDARASLGFPVNSMMPGGGFTAAQAAALQKKPKAFAAGGLASDTSTGLTDLWRSAYGLPTDAEKQEMIANQPNSFADLWRSAYGMPTDAEKREMHANRPQSLMDLWRSAYGQPTEAEKQKMMAANRAGGGGTLGKAVAVLGQKKKLKAFAAGGLATLTPPDMAAAAPGAMPAGTGAATPDPAAMPESPYPKTQTGSKGGEQDKELITQTVQAIKGMHPDPNGVLMAFVKTFGEAALKDLVLRVQGAGGGGAPVSDGMSDSVPATINGQEPAALSEGEFVIPADVVSGLGNGSTDAGAQQLQGMMGRVRQMRTGGAVQPPAINARGAMPV